ncbi:MAG: NUDIX domain-containing protein [Bacteroidales bacterium]|nr:NUDIX domain-containing protein [Bacteroidales bacterium]
MHPLSLFKYCPKCGSSHFVENNFKSKRCETCKFVYYFNSSAATAAFILNKDDKLLVAKRAKDPSKGTLDLPGGFIDLYETAEEAIKREIAEETGLTIEKFNYLFSLPNIYPYSGFEVHTVDLFFQCHINDFSMMQAHDDVEELFFLDKKEIKPELFGLKSIRKAVEIWLRDSFI